ncbi:MAG: glutaminyl-tRNA synthase (glutamine-hydrolyzing) subunit B [Elusimicrobia bacterium GWA2_61_42]|nr:MAG: glutaminyl-tRNA synthase (glutamine-hydrolyzing) subunit B [Elusimicrobia bacterium GWA2_61_42]OGR76601.1 MAG: glutaminyl-tRNA synthase (glutamine-hydrolyzing) subunit B [Elusimicrobia bacterium GWC2_61_25]
MTDFEPVIGLEVHAQLKTAAKLFCRCAAGGFDAPANTNICPVCTGQPGALPAANAGAVELAVRAGLALNCRVNEVSVFVRKNYFYPDLPKAYQISQYDLPLCGAGEITIDLKAGGTKKVRVRRAHLEEDAGKLLHSPAGGAQDHTLADFNRSGVPLLEIVSEPDLNSAEEAYSCLTELKLLLQWAGVCGCDMEKGELRCDVNVSLRPRGAATPGYKVEIKNLNSFKAARDAVSYEISRQAAALNNGETVARDTRLWDEKARRTEPMRSKEAACDYRYFPEPDLPPLRVAPELLAGLKSKTGDLPREARARFIRDFALNAYEAGVVASTRELAAYAEACMRHAATIGLGSKPIMNLLGGEFLARVNENRIAPKDLAEKAIRPELLVKTAALASSGKVSASAAKTLFARAWETGRDPQALLEELGLAQVSDPAQLEAWAREAIAARPKAAQDLKAGNERALGPLVGLLMEKSAGKANPRAAGEVIRKILGE